MRDRVKGEDRVGLGVANGGHAGCDGDTDHEDKGRNKHREHSNHVAPPQCRGYVQYTPPHCFQGTSFPMSRLRHRVMSANPIIL